VKESHVAVDQPLTAIAELTSNRLSRRFSGAICAVICLGYLIVGLYPYNFWQRNDVKWDPDGAGISLGWYSIIYSEKSIAFGRNGNGITIELMLKPDWHRSWHRASLLSLYRKGFDSLVVGQQGPDLRLSIPTSSAGHGRGYREVWLKNSLPPHSRRLLVVTAGTGGTSIYIDGMPIGLFPTLIPDVADLQGRLIFGNAPEGSHGWRGEISGGALFDRVVEAAEVLRHRNLVAAGGFQALSSEASLAALYLFDEKTGQTVKDHSLNHIPLLIPKSYHVLRRTYLRPVWQDSPESLDLVINILGFIPFGFFCFMYLIHRGPVLRSFIITIAFSASVSASIEILQAFIPRRTSSMADLICNTLGGLIGSLLVVALTKGRQRNSPADPSR
jgi:VanZ family protein